MRASAEAGAARLAGTRILAVEDEFVLLLEIATVLSNAGATVVKCATLEDALRSLDADSFAAAILDVRLGRETIAPVAHRLADLGTPFIFYTGHVATEWHLTQWPHVRIVSKPAPPAVLVNAVAELLDPAEPRARDQ
jgi:DNA-binding response OmpR family regulator